VDPVYNIALEHFNSLLERPIYAALAYGSQIAGYASKDSDYDLILIIDDYPDTIKYYYENVRGFSFSALVVDKHFFEEDVYHAKHGEFVSGRLFTVFIPLVNEEYIKKCEVDLKERTIIEESCDLISKYGELVEYLSVPLKFFLFSRLRRRIIAYPPVRYSYIKTFFGSKGEDNVNMSLQGFRRGAERLVRRGILEKIGPDLYRIVKSKLDCPNKIFIRLEFLQRGVKSYITHGRSAKVPPKVFLHEFQSKIRRGGGGELPSLLRDPHKLIHIEDSEVSGVSRNLYQALRHIYKDENVTVGAVKRTGLFSGTYIIEVNSYRGAERIVRKHFSYLDIFKWLILQFWLLDITRFNLMPSTRFLNEVRSSLRMREIGIKTFRPILFSWAEKSIYSKYIEGTKISELPSNYPLNMILSIIREVGRLIGYIHSAGYVFGDLKPQNIIFNGKDLYFTDLEQFSSRGDPSWDIAEFLYYSYIITSRYIGIPIEKFVSSFIEGYSESGDLKYVSRASSLKYLRPFTIIAPWNRLFKIRSSIKRLVT